MLNGLIVGFLLPWGNDDKRSTLDSWSPTALYLFESSVSSLVTTDLSIQLTIYQLFLSEVSAFYLTS